VLNSGNDCNLLIYLNTGSKKLTPLFSNNSKTGNLLYRKPSKYLFNDIIDFPVMGLIVSVYNLFAEIKEDNCNRY
jgi:hypothetical protein